MRTGDVNFERIARLDINNADIYSCALMSRIQTKYITDMANYYRGTEINAICLHQ